MENTGNDTATIVAATSASGAPQLLSPTLPLVIQPHEKIPFSWQWNVAKPGTYTDTLYYTASDTTLTTTLSFREVRPLLQIAPDLAFHFLCVGDSEIASVNILNASVDTIQVEGLHLLHGVVFSVFDTVGEIGPGDTALVHIRFEPASAAYQTDTLLMTASVLGCDSQYVVMLSGTGTTVKLAAEALDFDTVTAGQCKEDSLLIQNPCGPDIVIDSVISSGTVFRYVEPPLPLLVRSGSTIELHFLYCPIDSSLSEDTVLLIDSLHEIYTTTLHGAGRVAAKPWAHFTILKATVVAGDVTSTALRLDSTSLTGLHDLQATITFDPEVVSPESSAPYSGNLVTPDAYTFQGTFDFSNAPQFVASIRWLGLLGPRASTPLNLTLTADTELDVSVTLGVITVVDCSNLTGHVSVAGAYHLGNIIPDPVGGAVFGVAAPHVQIDLGNDGYVEAGIYDLTGRIEKQVLARLFERGSYMLSIPISGLSSGRHFFVICSLGWREIRPFLLIR